MFLKITPKNFHVQYPNILRHWSPRSEAFAGGDNLMTAVSRGWEVGNQVTCQKFWHAGVRCVSVYHFTLRKGDTEISMPVIENPYITRMLFTGPFEVIDEEANDKSKEVAV